MLGRGVSGCGRLLRRGSVLLRRTHNLDDGRVCRGRDLSNGIALVLLGYCTLDAGPQVTSRLVEGDGLAVRVGVTKQLTGVEMLCLLLGDQCAALDAGGAVIEVGIALGVLAKLLVD